MHGYAGVRKLLRKALDIAGLLAGDIDTEPISKVLAAKAKKRGGRMTDSITDSIDSVTATMQGFASTEGYIKSNPCFKSVFFSEDDN